MQAFVHVGTPRSYNNVQKGRYQDALRESFSAIYPNVLPNSDDALYGLVYFFSHRQTELDADNLSKPIWDALKGLAFDDDSRIQLRRAGILMTNRNLRQDIQFSHVPGHAADKIIELIGGRSDFLYIEVGKLSTRMYYMGLEKKYT